MCLVRVFQESERGRVCDCEERKREGESEVRVFSRNQNLACGRSKDQK